jgi:competence protein ComEC
VRSPDRSGANHFRWLAVGVRIDCCRAIGPPRARISGCSDILAAAGKMTSHHPSFAPHPLAMLAVALAIGILAARFSSIPLIALVIVSAATPIVVLWSLRARRARLASSMIVIAMLLGGAVLETIEKRSAPANQVKQSLNNGVIAPGDPIEITGVLDRPPEYAPEGFYLMLRVERVRFKNTERNASGTIELLAPVPDETVRAEYDALELRYGARLSVMTALERADNYRNPGVSSFTEYLDRKGYDASGVIKSPLLVERLDDERVFLPLAWLYDWRQKLEAQIKARFSPETAGVLDAALLGNRFYLSHEAAERFREGGTFHVLVINGLHITFIGGVVLLFARRITKRRFWQFVLSATILWAYALAVGAAASVVRATLMFTLIALAPVISRRANSLNALGGAGLLLLIWHPSDLFDPAFQLTFLSVLSIVVIAAPLLQKIERIGAWQPSQETPHPPVCSRWTRAFSEILFWSQRNWRQEMAQSSHHYLLFKSPLAARLERHHLQRFVRFAFCAVVISASVQIGMLPALILYFHRLSFAAIVLNIWVGLLMALLGVVALFALLLVKISATLATPLIAFANLIDWLMVHSVDLFSSVGGGSLRLPEYTGWPAAVYALYYVPLAGLALLLARWNPLQAPRRSREREEKVWRKATRVAGGFQLIFLFLIVAHPLSAGMPDGKLRVDFLDVGQGDAALVTMPDGTTLLVDGGGRPSFNVRKTDSEEDGPTFDDRFETPFERDTRSIGEAVVSEYLWWRGLDRIDYLLATHADADHIDGLNDVARNFKVRTAFVARTPRDDPEYVKFAQTLRERKIPVSILGAGDKLRFGEVTASVLSPGLTSNSNAPSRNNDSIVLRLQFGERTILTTGDVEKEGEATMLDAKADLRADVVKVPHHGSKTSSTPAFVDATHPRLAVISVGLTSVFGHPNKEVVDRWRTSGAEVLTTGRSGTITVTTDGKDLRIETFAKP